MGNTIYDSVTSNAIAVYYNEKENQSEPFLGEVLFPDKKYLGLELSWLKGAKADQTALKLSSFDAKAMKAERVGFSEFKQKMPFFKEKMSVSEEDRQMLNMVIAAGNQDQIDLVLNKIFADDVTLINKAKVAREVMRMQALTTGLVTVANNGQSVSVDYGVPNTQKTEVTTSWSDVSATIIDDIIDALDVVEASSGVRPTRAVCSRKVFRYMMKNTEIKGALTPMTVLTESAVRSYILDATGLTIQVYEKKYTNAAGSAVRYVPEDLFVMFPEGVLGETGFGTTPEESDLLGSNVANVSIVDTGVALTTSKEVDPVNVSTKVSQICLPSFPKADQVYILDIIAS